ncbi:MAG TPA: LUD domain-containing protein [Chloroflexia bacterium]|nr:LUD domain-containing protein [Chloroflexia bacterium]
MSDDALLEAFERYATAAGAQVTTVPDASAAAAAIAGLADGSVTLTGAVLERYPALGAALEQAGLRTVVAEQVEAEEGLTRQDVAVRLSGGTAVVLGRAGVAETGSVVLADDAMAPRLAGMLADVCVALLPEGAIVRDLDAAGTLIADLDRAGHRYVSLVTGPSRTADIERVLTIGVQGPKALHIIVLTGEAT